MDLETVLRIFRYSMQAPVYKENMEELTDIYGNFSFLRHNNINNMASLEGDLMTSNSDAKIFQCTYAGKVFWSPESCNLFFRSITNEGFGYSFNMGNFWDIFSNTSFNQNFAHIMRPKGHNESAMISDDDNKIYPDKGILYPEVSVGILIGMITSNIISKSSLSEKEDM